MENNIKIFDNERIDDLHRNGYKIIQSQNNFCFGCDAVLLSHFANIKKDEIVLDIGTGTGIIPILLEAKTEGKPFYGLEVQTYSAEMALRSVKLNALQDKIKIINGDVKNLSLFFKKNFFDVITTNPPYIKTLGGLKNEKNSIAIARHEILCTLEDIIKESSCFLKTNGRFYMVHKPHRLVEIFILLTKYNLEPKTMRYIYPKINKEPSMVLIEAVKNGKRMLKNLPALIIYNQDGTYTEEINKIYYY